MEVELRGEYREEPPIRLADGDGKHEHSLAERPVPVGIANERFARFETGQALRGKAHAPRSTAAHHGAPARIEDHERFLVGKPLAERVEISAQTAERFFAIPSIDFGQILSD